MFSKNMCMLLRKVLSFAAIALCLISITACNNDNTDATGNSFDSSNNPDVDNLVANPDSSGINVPDSFVAKIFADSIGETRHIVVSQNNVVYIKLMALKDGKGIAILKDRNNDGVADQLKYFGDFAGTGIDIYDNNLYASSDEGIYRYKINSDGYIMDTNLPTTIVEGLIARNEHQAKAFTIDPNGNIYVNIGAYSNACQMEDRVPGSRGMYPCPILDSAGGIWKFDANKINQKYKDGSRYATGLRNVVGLDWNTQTQSLFVMQHGRDQLADMAPKFFDAEKSAEIPAESLYELHQGDNAGWPYVYYDPFQKKLLLAPEYGGNGKRKADSSYLNPIANYPAHWAPNGLLFYTGNQFPAKYKNGAFIAFHGSWNRAPKPQQGFCVVFQPFKDGKPFGDYEIFAKGFPGTDAPLQNPGDAAHRPCGLAQGPDGALYVTDDVKGRVYKITYSGK
ncbi:sorbosone dehydrogenase [Rhizosphaericola mali]|uniref:Sorbosone dehydrogenase n=2 Tax=Rhizosphaericola mali TaxID=2545455 RepID=A0A5P2G1N6_9BACT|nr:sorbosone dehydrogenase [Rhizosphaericola mali]